MKGKLYRLVNTFYDAEDIDGVKITTLRCPLTKTSLFSDLDGNENEIATKIASEAVHGEVNDIDWSIHFMTQKKFLHLKLQYCVCL